MIGRDRTMIFVDGSNLLTQLGRHYGFSIRPESPPDEALELAHAMVNDLHGYLNQFSNGVIRKYWFGSIKGDDKQIEATRLLLRKFDFEPVIFKRTTRKEKGVDIALTRQMLVNAFAHNFAIGILVAGDRDYVELLEEAKRYGCEIWVSFFDNPSLAGELRVAADRFWPLPNPHTVSATKIEQLVAKLKAMPSKAGSKRTCEECDGEGEVAA